MTIKLHIRSVKKGNNHNHNRNRNLNHNHNVDHNHNGTCIRLLTRLTVELYTA